ncbi:MAG: immunoglobulin domain-containing protein, partial [Limisphaerales bacterium]
MRLFRSLLLLLCFSWIVQPLGAQVNFNITPLSIARPYSGKGYGDVWGEGDIACLGIYTGYNSGTLYGVGIYDISNPALPVFLANYRAASGSHNQFEHGMVRDRIGYFASWSGGGVHIVSLTNPASPQTLSAINTASNGFARVHTMFLERDFLYEAAHVAGIETVKVFNISNPSAPVFLQDIVTTNTTKVHQITVANKGTNVILYTSGWGGNSDGNPSSYGQTDIWDVSNVGTQPAKWLGRVYSGYSSHSSWPTPDGNTLIVCRETQGGEVRLYDITTPPNPSPHVLTNPAPIAVISPANMGLPADLPHNPVVVGNLLFVSWYQNGLQIFDISDRTKPVRVGSYDTYLNASTSNFQGNWGVYPFLGLNKVLVSDIQSGLWIMDVSQVLTGTNNYAPLLVKNPTGLTVQQGDSAEFSPVITGSQLSYQWRFNGANLAGATGSSHTIPYADPEHSGNYSVIAYNASGSVTSSVAPLNVVGHPSAPSITAQPQTALVYPEQSASFSVAVTGAEPMYFQWRRDGNDIPGATNSFFNIEHVHLEHLGTYSVRITNSFGGVSSLNAPLILIDSPYIFGVSSRAGTHSAVVSWSTTIPTDGKVDFGPVQEGSITGSSPRELALSTNHSVLLSGLQPGTTYNYQTVSRANGTNYLSTVYKFTTLSTNAIILDNTSSGVSFSGTWTTSTAVPNYYGDNYRYAATNLVTSSPTRTATYTPSITAAGLYDIDVWHTSAINRATNAPFTVIYSGGQTLVSVNQQLNSGQWFPLIKK